MVFNVLGVHEYLDGRQLELSAPNENGHMVSLDVGSLQDRQPPQCAGNFNDVVALKEESTRSSPTVCDLGAVRRLTTYLDHCASNRRCCAVSRLERPSGLRANARRYFLL